MRGLHDSAQLQEHLGLCVLFASGRVQHGRRRLPRNRSLRGRFEFEGGEENGEDDLCAAHPLVEQIMQNYNCGLTDLEERKLETATYRSQRRRLIAVNSSQVLTCKILVHPRKSFL